MGTVLTMFVLVVYLVTTTSSMTLNESLPASPHSHYHPHDFLINVAFVSCGHLAAKVLPAALASVMSNASRLRINLYLVVDSQLVQDIMRSCTFPILETVRNHVYNVTIWNYEEPETAKWFANLLKDTGEELVVIAEDGRLRFVDMKFQCASLKLLWPMLVPEHGKMLVLDADTLVFQDLADLWNEWKTNASSAGANNISVGLFGMALESVADKEEIPYFGGKQHYYRPSGLNSGVMLMNMNRMRSMNLTVAQLYKVNDEPVRLSEQDVLNTWAYYHPQYIFVLPCKWNKRPTSKCDEDYYNVQSGILHGNVGAFVNFRREHYWELGSFYHWTHSYFKWCNRRSYNTSLLPRSRQSRMK